MNQCKETLVTTNVVIYVVTEYLNGKPENYKSRRKPKQPL